MKPSVRKAVLFLAAFALLSAAPHRRAGAWGPAGHRIVALMAMKHLTAEASAQVKALLGDETLADVANWADDVRDSRPNTAKWHFVNLPKTATAFDRSRDCRAAGPDDPGCAVTAIETARDILSGARAGDKAEALKFLVHFVGDLHQPLHVSFKADKGGNNIDVTFFGQRSNLHKVWDSGIIRQADLSDEEFAAELEAVLWEGNDEEEVGRNIERLQAGSVDSWANESYALARSNAYDNVPRSGKARLGTAYYEGILKGAKKPNWQVVDEQLTKAGLRLAKILNEVFDPGRGRVVGGVPLSAQRGEESGVFSEPVRISPAHTKVLADASAALKSSQDALRSRLATLEGQPTFAPRKNALFAGVSEARQQLTQTKEAFLARTASGGNDANRVRTATQMVFQGFELKYDKALDDVREATPSNYTATRGKVFDLLDSNLRAYTDIAEEGVLTFDLQITSTPPESTIFYRREGDSEYTSNGKSTDASIENLVRAIWYVRVEQEGYVPQEKPHDAWREKNHVLDFKLQRNPEDSTPPAVRQLDPGTVRAGTTTPAVKVRGRRQSGKRRHGKN